MYSMQKIGASVPGAEKRGVASCSRSTHLAAAAAAPRFAAPTRDLSSSSRCSSSSSSSPAPLSSAASQRLASPAIAKCSTPDASSTIASTIRNSLSAVLLSSVLLAAPMVSAPQSTATTTNPDVEVRAVEEYAELEAAGKMRNTKALDDFRGRYRMRRTMDGRLQVKSSKGEWWAVRLDMEVPGALLLRDPAGNVFAVQTETLQQIDLSDDYVCLLMFADGAWEEQMAPVDYTDEKGATQQLKLQEKEFREVVGILKEAAEEAVGEEEGGR